MKKIAMAVFITMVIASCAKEEKSENAELEQITLSATFATSPSAELKPEQTSDQTSDQKPEHQAESRATATAFESGDELGLFVVRSGMEVQSKDNLVNNHKMVVGSDGVIKGTPTAVYYPTSSAQTTSPTSQVTIHSYYPYQSGNATADALGVLVGIRTDQTDFLDVKRSDLCYGSARDIAPSKTAKVITFKHSFAQIRVNVTLFAGCPAVKQLRLINVKDSATLNMQTGAISLKSHTAEVLAYKSTENSYSTIIPAQTLNGACVAIDLVDNKTTYIFNAISPIDLTQSATNTLNLAINDKGVASLSSTPSVTAWGVNNQSGVMGEEVHNTITLRWLAPHSDYATADKIVLTVVDLFNVTREIESALTLDPTSSAEYAVYTFPLSVAGVGYPMIITQARIYNGATLLRQSPQAAILGATLYRAGSHVMGLNLAIDISPSDDWVNVANTAQSRVVTINTIGTDNWTATASGAGLSVTPSGTSGKTATISWAAQITNGDSPARSGTVTFSTLPSGVTYTINTNQLMGPYYLAINPAGNWTNVANTLQSRAVTVNTGNISGWTVAASGAGLSVNPTSGTNGGNTTITWQANSVVGALARSGSVTFSPNPASTAAPIVVTTSQVAGPAPTLTLSAYGPGVTVPKGGGTYYATIYCNTGWSSSGTYTTISPASGWGNTNIAITVVATSLSTTRSVNAVFKTNAVPSGATATQTWSGTQEAAGPANSVNINGTWWSLSNTGDACPWYTALTRCVSPWRLPSKADFQNLINSGKMSSVTGISSSIYWSSTQDNTSDAWYLYYGTLTSNYKGSYYDVRCCQ